MGGTSAASTASQSGRARRQARQRSSTARAARTRTRRQDCRILGDVNSVQAYWKGWFQARGKRYGRHDGVLHRRHRHRLRRRRPATSAPSTARSTSTSTSTSASTGSCSRPLRCAGRPVRRGLRDRARVRPPRQDLLGDLGARQRARARGRRRCAPSCRPTATPASGRATRLRPATSIDLTQQDINEGLDAAAAVGDDRIQTRDAGPGEPETWTHGSAGRAATLVHRGYRARRAGRCDAFSGSL